MVAELQSETATALSFNSRWREIPSPDSNSSPSEIDVKDRSDKLSSRDASVSLLTVRGIRTAWTGISNL